jgi:hypothetical protein
VLGVAAGLDTVLESGGNDAIFMPRLGELTNKVLGLENATTEFNKQKKLAKELISKGQYHTELEKNV